MFKKLIPALLIGALTIATSLSQAETKAKISDLNWMTGSYAAALGPMTLEENWIVPTDGSIASLVRMTGNGKTSMIELIVIEEEGDTLVLRIQQWDPGFKARAPQHQTMKLVSVGENQVGFEAITEGSINTLAYSKPEADTFNIDIINAAGKKMHLSLKAR